MADLNKLFDVRTTRNTQTKKHHGSNEVSDAVSPIFISFARTLFSAAPIICDIGSRDAQEGIFLLQQLKGKRLHVFEPNPEAANICRRNIALSKQDSELILFNPVAVTDSVGPVAFYPVNAADSENKDIGFSSLFAINPDYTNRRGRVSQDEIIVDGTTLDVYFAGKDYPDILWIDVEGAELKVLRGATNVLRHVTLLHIEVSFRPMQIGKPLFWEIRRHLVAYGFSFHSFMEVSALRGFLYRHRLLPNLPWRLNAVFYRKI